MQHILDKAGIEVTKENRKEIDKLIHSLVGVDYKNCPATWKEVKKRMAEDEERLIARMNELWKKH
jgi:hypothetical protein